MLRYEGGHGSVSVVIFYAFQEGELVPRPYEIVFGIFGFVIGVPVEVVSQEAYALHVREQFHCERQHERFRRCYERLGSLEVSLGERLEYFGVEGVESDFCHVWVVFGRKVCGIPEEIAVVGKDEARHDGVQIYYGQDFSVVIEQQSVYFSVSMADALWQSSLGIKPFGGGHVFGPFLYYGDKAGDGRCP